MTTQLSQEMTSALWVITVPMARLILLPVLLALSQRSLELLGLMVVSPVLEGTTVMCLPSPKSLWHLYVLLGTFILKSQNAVPETFLRIKNFKSENAVFQTWLRDLALKKTVASPVTIV